MSVWPILYNIYITTFSPLWSCRDISLVDLCYVIWYLMKLWHVVVCLSMIVYHCHFVVISQSLCLFVNVYVSYCIATTSATVTWWKLWLKWCQCILVAFLCYISLLSTHFYHDQCHYVLVITQPLEFLAYSSRPVSGYGFSGACLLVTCMGMLCYIVIWHFSLLLFWPALFEDSINTGSMTGVLFYIFTLVILWYLDCLCSFSFMKWSSNLLNFL